MSAHWPHWLRIVGPRTDGSGNLAGNNGTTSDDGVYKDSPVYLDEEILYDGPADVQDGGRMFNKDNGGDYSPTSDAVAFLKDEKAIGSMIKRTGLRAEITWEDQTVDIADIQRIRRLDATIWLKRV